MEKETMIYVFEVLKNPLIYESIRLASPELVATTEKYWANPSSFSSKKKEALAFSLLKYYARMASRCTPFGLFAGCTVGDISAKTAIILEPSQRFKRHTQFDMQLWIALLQKLASQNTVQQHLTYYPNTSIYPLGDFYRYVEYKYVKTKREHSITALRKSEVLHKVFNATQKGKTIEEIVNLIAADDSEIQEAKAFIEDLIRFQFLIPNLEGTVTGTNEWDRVMTILDGIPTLKTENKILTNIKKQFAVLDSSLIPPEKSYDEIQRFIQNIGVDYDVKYLFQTDLSTATTVNTVSDTVSSRVLEAIRFLNGIQKQNESVQLSNFKKAFIQRYESSQMSLATVLDSEIGIGYLQNKDGNDTHDILDKFSIRIKSQENENQSWTADDYIIEKKLQACIAKNENKIALTEKDFPDFDANWDKAPATFSVMIALINNTEISIESSGDVSAAKLLGRFCNGNNAIHKLTNAIVDKEKKYNSDKILAEVVHIPESRMGNILRRPVLRDYEIGYLSNSGVSQERTITINELLISVKNDRIVLRSNKHNKVVIPCLSNAHNYRNNSLPAYHFLCDLQAQGIKPIYSFSWGVLELHYDYFPRVYYKTIILSKAKWVVIKNEIVSFSKLPSNQVLDQVTTWRMERKMPRYLNWVNGDNTLLIDFEKEVGVQLFLKSVKQRPKIVLEEFLFNKESAVKDAKGAHFANQIILSFYKEKQ